VSNYGTIGAVGTSGFGVLLPLGGAVKNGSSGAPAALIGATGKAIGVYIGGYNGTRNPGATATVVNYGTIAAGSDAVGFVSGGIVANSGLITGGANGVELAGGAASVILNFGHITGAARGFD
jgi:hypothetical protein